MKKVERSEKSRGQILEAALELFSHRGFGATSVRDIANHAGISIGNVYHHFPEKEAVFQTLLEQFWDAADSPDFPLNAVMAEGVFPENLEALGRAAEQVIRTWRRHVALIYIDVIEFDGQHIRKFYSQMSNRAAEMLSRHPHRAEMESRLAPGVSPASALLFAIRFFLNYFTVEILFGVENHFGKSPDEMMGELARIIRFGVERRGDEPADGGR